MTKRQLQSMHCGALVLGVAGFTQSASAATLLDGSQLSAWFALPLLGLLLVMALLPLVAVHFWHRNDAKIVTAFALATALALVLEIGWSGTLAVAWHTFLHEYLPFVILISSLYVITGGIHIVIPHAATPGVNTLVLLSGSILASLIGTTGATMLLIRPLLAMNMGRKHKVHVIVFFIFMVANIGGLLTPIGDPPLFVGFLKGVDFFWTIYHLFPHFLLTLALGLAMFYMVDRYFARREGQEPPSLPADKKAWRFEGSKNFFALCMVIILVIISGNWKDSPALLLFGEPLRFASVLRDLGLLSLAAWSWFRTSRSIRAANRFNWFPVKEVVVVFAAIFLCLAPVQAMLQAGSKGPFASLVTMVVSSDGNPIPFNYFWLTGVFSAFLDNAPTYLLFFNLAGGDAAHLMTQGAHVLMAISAGSVFMGALSYIGNAPNLMARSIAQHAGVAMPSFLVYMLWSTLVLLPIFCLVALIFF